MIVNLNETVMFSHLFANLTGKRIKFKYTKHLKQNVPPSLIVTPISISND